MPNWCTNKVKITGNEIQLKKTIEKMTKERLSPILQFGDFIPFYGDEPSEKWLNDAWGVRHELSDDQYVKIEENSIRLEFDTAWQPPLRFFRNLSVIIPGLKINIKFFQAGDMMLGEKTYELGEDTHSDVKSPFNEKEYLAYAEKHFDYVDEH